MRFENKSKFYPDEKLLPMIEFIEARSSLSDLATLQVIDTPAKITQTSGMAWKHRPDVGPLSLVAPCLIRLMVSRCLTYPQTSGHSVPQVLAQCGTVTYRNWEEEVLFVLAHESAHISDFFTRNFTDEIQPEIEAERFAFWVLKAWRKAHKSNKRTRSLYRK